MARDTTRPVAHRNATGRPSIKKVSRKVPFFKTTSYSVAKKLCIINAARDTSINDALDTYFPGLTGTPRKTAWKRIFRWEQCRPTIEAAANEPSNRLKKSMRPQGTSTTLDKATEEGLADWVTELRSEGIPVSNLLLQSRALEVARDLGFGPNDFKASNAWIQGCMKRWRFAMRSKSRAGQADLAQGEAKLAEFSARIRDVVATRGVETIYNADQTGINYEYIPKKTINQQGAKTVWIKGSGHEKDRLTAMVLADSNGVNAHFTDEVVQLAEELNVILEKIPPSFTWICQPADVAWMKPKKSALRRRWVEYLRTEVQNHREGKFKLTPPDRYDLVEWLLPASNGLLDNVCLPSDDLYEPNLSDIIRVPGRMCCPIMADKVGFMERKAPEPLDKRRVLGSARSPIHGGSAVRKIEVIFDDIEFRQTVY
ncbi:hypothetical protein H257_10938 [Aphanomyces astaci]|uniref:HTH CENPB-type domain-containing protein n=1 Tax=Aphanomyces astaci TaxID=112090 RepID=W4G3Q3_APHAT|nr:hypothetical protein H257_10938 [Aphanomyces astaci]ETV74347.1 hypothetical protein H257_10938 [Aphanomyces astaci]|eukprot:XP_009836005.1 hypothetical protein H257_10938 [Aphanomyces astaci]